jgi:hypothetical protein
VHPLLERVYCQKTDGGLRSELVLSRLFQQLQELAEPFDCQSSKTPTLSDQPFFERLTLQIEPFQKVASIERKSAFQVLRPTATQCFLELAGVDYQAGRIEPQKIAFGNYGKRLAAPPMLYGSPSGIASSFVERPPPIGRSRAWPRACLGGAPDLEAAPRTQEEPAPSC